MIKLKKKFTALLSLALALSLAGCGSKDKEETEGSDEPKTEDVSGSKEEGEKDGDKPDTWIADREITLLVFESASDAGEDSMSPEIAKYIKDKTGITLKIQSVSNEDSTEALSAGLASGDLPDAIAFYLDNSGRPEFPLLLQASNEGMFTDLAPYLKDSKIYGKYFEDGYLPSDTKNNIMMREDQDGATYLVHMSINRKPADPGRKLIGGMYMRKDIADDLGVKTDDIKTSADLEKLLEKIAKGGYKDDNGNPVTPLGPTLWGGSERPWPYQDLVWQGAGGQKFLKDGDTVKHESMTDYGEKRVALVRKWLKEGLMHPEFYTMEETRAQEGIANGSFAIIADSHNYRPEMQSMRYIPLGDLKRADGSDDMVIPYKSGYTGRAIPSTTKNPEEIVKFADRMASKEGKLLYFYGLEGVHYDMVDGKPLPKKELVDLVENDPDKAKKEGFRGVGAYWGEHFCYTDMDQMDDFGEMSWGDKVREGEESGAKKIIDMYDFDKKYEDATIIDGLYPKAYLFEFEGDGGELSQALDDWEDDILKAYYASSDDEAAEIIKQAKTHLKDAGIEDFCKFLEDKEKAGDTIFY